MLIGIFWVQMKLKIPTMPCSQTLIDHEECGHVVRVERSKKGISLLNLADKLNISSPFLSDLERGKRNWTEERFKTAMQIIEKSPTT